MFAQVVVDAVIRQELGDPEAGIFTYAIPDPLRSVIRPGHLVWVPFSGRRLQGVVLEVTERAPSFPVLSIESLAYDQPVLLSHQIALARWLSRRYLAPLWSCVQQMLPAGVARRVESRIRLTTAPPFPPDLTREQRRLLDLLQQGAITRRQLRRRWPPLARRAVVEPLRRRGLIAIEQAPAEPGVRPRVAVRARLVADPATIDRVLPSLGRPSRQADVLAWLARARDPLPSLAEVCAGAGCRERVIRELAARGWVQVLPRRRMVAVRDREEARAVLQAIRARAPAQANALAALLEADQPVAEDRLCQAHGIRRDALRALARRGVISRWTEPPVVMLTLDDARVSETIASLRGLERYQRVLAALQAAGGEAWVGYLYAETGCDRSVLQRLAEAGLIALEEREQPRDPLASRPFPAERPPELTVDQQGVWEVLRRELHATWSRPRPHAAEAPEPPPVFLIHGVTGSGKTELYLRAIELALTRDRQAIVLVPEIALTPQAIQRFAARFPGRVTIWHSALSPGERFDLWRRMHRGEIDVVIGSRSALFAPLPRLGLLIVDEEHEPAYKQERTPRYHARDAALALGRIVGAPVILGSATPSLESYYAARSGRYRLLSLPRRVRAHQAIGEPPVNRPIGREQTTAAPSAAIQYAKLPAVEIVDLRQELREGNRSIFSRRLQTALAETLERGEQAILFLNRRGAATFVMCRSCGLVLRCPRCDIPMAYHRPSADPAMTSDGEGTLLCHHCNRRMPPPAACPECGSTRIRYFGAGTQRVVQEVTRCFPEARVIRWDRDVTGRRGAHERILARFLQKEADILVGTQMVAKGLDLPLVTLVGVIAADIGLNLPDFRAAERTFQLLAQVAGRAGRSPLGGRVIIQTYNPDHYAVQAARAHDFDAFYRQEIAFRRELGYPPFTRLARLIHLNSHPLRAQEEAERVAELLRQRLASREIAGNLIGPAPCFFARERGRYRWQIILCAPEPAEALRGLSLSPAWRVDIDPVDLL